MQDENLVMAYRTVLNDSRVVAVYDGVPILVVEDAPDRAISGISLEIFGDEEN